MSGMYRTDGSGEVDRAEFAGWLRTKDGLNALLDNTKYEILCKALRLFDRYDEGERYTKLYMLLGAHQ